MIAEKNGHTTIKLPKSELVSEHKHLVGVLRSGSRKQRSKEAKEQSHELGQYRKAKPRKAARASGR